MKTLNARQEVKLNMYDVVVVKCDENAAVVNKTPALADALDEFKTKVASIHDAAPTSAAVITGFATDKTTHKKTVSELTSFVAGKIYAYAAKTKNPVLKEASDFSLSDLKRTKDGEFAARCQTIHDLGAANIAALADFGLTNASLTELQAAIDSYAASAPKPRAALTDRVTVKFNIRKLFFEADEILAEQMDKIVESMSKTEPDFVNTYFAARVILDPKQKKKKPDGTNTGGENNPPA